MNVKYKIVEVMENNDAEQSIVGWGSKPIPDRDGELIKSNAWKLEAYRKNPVLMLSHDYSSPPVGKCLWVKADNSGLRFKAKFASTDRGKEVYQLYKECIMSGFSVGFSVNAGGSVDHPTDAQYKGLKRVYSDVELLEISCVAIPACPDALIEQVKSGKIVSKQLKDELEHVIEIIEKAKLDDKKKEEEEEEKKKEGEASEDEKDEKEGEESEDEKKKKEEEKKSVSIIDADSVRKYLEEHPEMVQEMVGKATPKCPADGEYGMDYGDYDECGDCSFAEGCEAGSGTEEEKALRRKPKEGEGEGEDKKKPCQKMKNPEGAPSIYDLVSCLNQTLRLSMDTVSERPVMVGEARLMSEPTMGTYVVDVFPVDYPSGNFIFSTGSKYYRMNYQYDEEMAGCDLTGVAEPVEQGWVSNKYQLSIEQKEAEVVTKEGRVLSEKNRKLLKECIDKMGECSGMLSGFHEATGKPEAYTNIRSVEQPDEDEDEGFEIEQKEFDLSDIIEKSAEEKNDNDDDLLEIDAEMLKGVLKDAFAESVKSGAEAAVTRAFNKIKGKVI